MKNILVVILALLVPSLGHAWGNPGHMAVAKVAYDLLSPTQRSDIIKVLRQHPDLAPINDGFANGKPDDESLFIAAATWPDLIRTDGHYVDIGYEEDKQEVGTIKYEMIKHTGWHFQDNYFWNGPGTGAIKATPKVNAVAVVTTLIEQIKSKEDDKERAYELMWLFHLVGDLHHPTPRARRDPVGQ